MSELKPWEILRKAERICFDYGYVRCPERDEMLALADQLKSAEVAHRERRIENAAKHLWAASNQYRELDEYRIDARALDEAGLLKDVDDE
ncbi:hypothetical protein HUN08_12340 [Gordonia sp. X0973]|uniref:hypothetical protein n=1 Tax=Gordonia sp. X0973 TaxID=2742602 RepID=UPI000F5439BE|nr:hypothetical protein [Gordonia sp. X0973]QKT07884.1 hypothetical protein HUN08_12340 [Gordonia sp. X0973]